MFERIKFRWNHNRDPLPGEVKPTERGAMIIWIFETIDAESCLFLRKLRGLITGYGESWTFFSALWDWLWFKFLFSIYVILVYLFIKVLVT